MSSGGSNGSNSALKAVVSNSVSVSVSASGNANTSGNGSASAAAVANAISLTPRFTSDEKDILYQLFHQHEKVIDIKYRKKQKGKYSVRDAWQQIVDGFNGHANITTQRNIKQIQKFWLNARLRKQYPFQPSNKGSNHRRTSRTAGDGLNSNASDHPINVPAPIKCEPEFSFIKSDTPESTHNGDEYEEIELHATSITDPLNVEAIDEATETQQMQQNHQQMQQINQQQQQQAQQQQHQQQQQTTIQTQQINVDQISADKLTLNDLLHFKNARPREEIILQIKHPDGGSLTLPSPTRITIPHQQTTFNQIIGEIKPQTQHIQLQQYQTTQQIQQQAPQQQQIQQQYNAANSTFCTYTTQHLPQVATPTNITQANNSGNTTSFMVAESFEDKINYFKLKEAELRHKEVQLQLEQKRIDLSRMQEELKHQKEMHRLQVEEMRIKIRILSEEEKRLRNKES